mgnify:FL=1
MHYYVDGYNLLFRLFGASDNLKSSRQKIISDLNQKIKTVHIDVTIVFDAQHHVEEQDRLYMDAVEIIYTSHGQIADEWIIDELKNKKKPTEHVVVTSDKKLAYRAKIHMAKTQTVEEFVSWLARRFVNQKRKESLPTLEKKIKKKEIVQETVVIQEDVNTYYLKSFENNYKKILEDEIKNEKILSKSNESEKKRKSLKKKNKKEDDLFLMDYWLKSFERNIEE